MQLCIVELDKPAKNHSSVFGGYGDMLGQWLSPALPEAWFSRGRLNQDGPLPALTDYDGYMQAFPAPWCGNPIPKDVAATAALGKYLNRAEIARVFRLSGAGRVSTLICSTYNHITH
jgi:hypothetical protein